MSSSLQSLTVARGIRLSVKDLVKDLSVCVMSVKDPEEMNSPLQYLTVARGIRLSVKDLSVCVMSVKDPEEMNSPLQSLTVAPGIRLSEGPCEGLVCLCHVCVSCL